MHGAVYMEHSYKSAPDIELVNNEHTEYVMRQRFLSEDAQFQLQGSEYWNKWKQSCMKLT